MRVGLNATCFNDRPSGAKQRFVGIYGALIRRLPDVEFIVYEPADCRVGSWFDGAANVSVRRTPVPSSGRMRRVACGAVYWRKALRGDRLDLFETFHLPLVRAPDCPTILTVHDARPVLKEVPLIKRLPYGWVLRRALRQADHVVTVSDTIKGEIRAIEPSARVTTIYNGIDAARFTSVEPAAAEAICRRLGLPPDFLLAVGHLEARKNYPRLLAAIAALRDGGSAPALVIVGNDGGDRAAIEAAIDRHGLGDRVRILSGVSDAELAALYDSCRMVVFPSYYEGFGIPVLEAMAARRPLVLSDIPVFRELTEGRGAYFPLGDSDAMAKVLADMLSDRERQRAWIEYGAGRVRDFAFPNLAAQIGQLYRGLA